MLHVVRAFPPPSGTVHGQHPAQDAEIAKWCAVAEYVLITCDQDFRGRWVRSGLLREHNVEVVVFTEELSGLREQHARVTRHLPYWEQELSKQPFAFRVWEQGRQTLPALATGQRRRKRSRSFPPVVRQP